MKALSIRQPWAWLIAHGYKDIENRTWLPRKPFFKFAIHAPKTFDANGYAWVQENFIDIPLPSISKFKFGGIIGQVEYRGHVQGIHPNPWFTGPYGWLLANPQPINFIPCKGQLGLFEIQLHFQF